MRTLYLCDTLYLHGMYLHGMYIVFMPPTLKKWGTYWFRLVRVYVCIQVKIKKRRFI